MRETVIAYVISTVNTVTKQLFGPFVLRVITIFGSFNAELKQFSQMSKNLFQTIQLRINIHFQCQKQSYFKHFSLAIVHRLLFQTVQFSISAEFSYFLPIGRTLSGTSTPDQSGPESDGNEGVFRIPQISSITGTTPSDFLMSYPGHSLRGYPSAQKQPVHYIA